MRLLSAIHNRGPVYGILLAVSLLSSIGFILTLVPNPLASWPNILGYKSLCTFTPGASFACALVAALSCTIRARLVKKTAFPFFVPLAAIALLSIGLVVSTAVWASVKAQYTAKPDTSLTVDAVTAPSEPDGDL